MNYKCCHGVLGYRYRFSFLAHHSSLLAHRFFCCVGQLTEARWPDAYDVDVTREVPFLVLWLVATPKPQPGHAVRIAVWLSRQPHTPGHYQVYVGQVYVGQVYVGQVYVGQVYVGQVYVGQVYVGQVYVGQVFLEKLQDFPKNIVATRLCRELSLDTLLKQSPSLGELLDFAVRLAIPALDDRSNC